MIIISSSVSASPTGTPRQTQPAQVYAEPHRPGGQRSPPPTVAEAQYSDLSDAYARPTEASSDGYARPTEASSDGYARLTEASSDGYAGLTEAGPVINTLTNAEYFLTHPPPALKTAAMVSEREGGVNTFSVLYIPF